MRRFSVMTARRTSSSPLDAAKKRYFRNSARVRRTLLLLPLFGLGDLPLPVGGVDFPAVVFHKRIGEPGLFLLQRQHAAVLRQQLPGAVPVRPFFDGDDFVSSLPGRVAGESAEIEVWIPLFPCRPAVGQQRAGQMLQRFLSEHGPPLEIVPVRNLPAVFGRIRLQQNSELLQMVPADSRLGSPRLRRTGRQQQYGKNGHKTRQETFSRKLRRSAHESTPEFG